MNVRIGTAPDSWGVWFASDPRQTPWNRFLDEVVQAGYEWIELGPYGYLPAEAARLRPELEKRRLKVSGSFVMAHLEDAANWPALEKQVLSMGALLAALGAGFLVLIDDGYSDPRTGAPTRPPALDGDGWKRLLDTTHRAARLARERFHLRLIFHPHAETHVEHTPQVEMLLRQTDPALVSLYY